MAYFLRTFVLYLVLFSATAYGVHRGMLYYFADELNQPIDVHTDSMSLVMPRIYIPPRETESGLLLSGIVAQNRRDWNQAWQDFSALHERYSTNPEFALRAFTLALGNGDFAKAEELAITLSDMSHDDGDAEETITEEKYDLARLFIVLQTIKNDQYKKALSGIEVMVEGPLAGFSKPILLNWIIADIDPDALTGTVEGLNPLQLLNKALAAEYAGKIDLAKDLMAEVDLNRMTAEKIETIAAFYIRNDEEEKARALVRQGVVSARQDSGLIVLHSRLEQDTVEPLTSEVFPLRPIMTPLEAIAQAYYDFARAMMSEGAIDSALLFTRMAIYLNPETDGVYMTAAELLKYQGQYEQALNAFAMVDVNDADFEKAITEQASILSEQKKWEQSEQIIRNAITAQQVVNLPENAYFYFLLGSSLHEQKKYDEALIAYNKAESLAKAETGSEIIQRALWPLYYMRAVIYDVTDQWDLAEQDLLYLLDLAPENPLVLNYLGYSYADKNINLEKAKDMISRAVSAAPNDAHIVDSMGWILYRIGEYDQAVEVLERAAALAPYHMVINDHLGDAYWQVGRRLEAHYMWRRALDYYDPDNVEQLRMIDETRRKVKEGL